MVGRQVGFLRRGRGRGRRRRRDCGGLGGWEGRGGEGGDWEAGVECTIQESRIII